MTKLKLNFGVNGIVPSWEPFIYPFEHMGNISDSEGRRWVYLVALVMS